MVRYSKWISLFAFALLLVACFMPWTYHADVSQNFTGFYSAKNIYGKPAKLLLVFAGITTLCSFVPVLWMKRTALLVGGLNVAYGIKNFLLFGSCYLGYCPEKKLGLFLMLIATIIIFLMSFFPDGKVKRSIQQ
ncbi:MAG: hypothetical protein RL642_582 [Bacteroidota bacterium]|jgi:hypothetical protein